MQNLDYYTSIPAFTSFSDVSNPAVYKAAPETWSIVITDVRGSTKAIEEGRYKDINIVGVCSIIGVINALGSQQIPYVFGGDGATLLVPNSTLDVVREALRATQVLAKQKFDLDLRVGVVAISELKQKSHDVFVARYRLSDTTTLAMMRGSGTTAAEGLIKSAELGKNYLIEPDSEAMGNFEGLECRWQPVKAKRGEMVSLLVKALDPKTEAQIYREVIEHIDETLKTTNAGLPVSSEQIVSSWPVIRDARGELLVRLNGKSFFEGLKYFAWLNIVSLAGIVGRTFNVKIRGTDVRKYVDELVANTDFRKFDDLLRMVIDCTPKQRTEIESYLERKFQDGQVVYGTHISNEALMTCLVFSLQNHVHFVDGSSGGYAMAAKQLKSRWQKVRTPS